MKNNIVYETDGYFIVDAGDKRGYEVYKVGVTCAERCAIIGKSLGVERAISEVNRRKALDNARDGE